MGYVCNNLPSVTLSRFLRLSPIAMSNMHVASRSIIPSDEPRKSSISCIVLVLSCNLSIADCMSRSMSSARLLFSEDSDSISFNTFFEPGIKISVISYYVNRSPCSFFEKISRFHKKKRIRCCRFYKHIHIAIAILLFSCSRTKKAKRKNTIFILQSVFASTEYVYTFSPCHMLSVLFCCKDSYFS